MVVYTADGATCFLQLRLVFCANLAWGLNRYDTGTGTTTATLPYMALAAATQEAKFLRQLFADMQGCNVECVCLHVDNQGAIGLYRDVWIAAIT